MHTKEALCPHCGEPPDDTLNPGSCLLRLLQDGDKHVMLCDRCEKSYVVTARVRRDFFSEAIEDVDPAQL